MPAPSRDTLLEVLNDHYKETCNFIQKQVGLRERLFTFIILIVGLMLFQMYSPKESGQTISSFISKKLEIENTLDISFIGSLIWFGLFALTLRYYQTVVLIERQYRYIHGLEDQLSKFYNQKAFTREGKSYLNKYPKFSNWTWALYTIAFPVLLMLLVGIKIWNEIEYATNLTGILIFNFIIFVCILISTILYMFHQHRGR